MRDKVEREEAKLWDGERMWSEDSRQSHTHCMTAEAEAADGREGRKSVLGMGGDATALIA